MRTVLYVYDEFCAGFVFILCKKSFFDFDSMTVLCNLGSNLPSVSLLETIQRELIVKHGETILQLAFFLLLYVLK